MAEDVKAEWTRGRHAVLLWAGILVAPAAWIADLSLSYALVNNACSTGRYYILHVVSVFCFLLALAGAFVAFRQLGAVPGSPNTEGGSAFDRSYFMARFGIVSSLGFALVIVAMAVPRFILNPCD